MKPNGSRRRRQRKERPCPRWSERWSTSTIVRTQCLPPRLAGTFAAGQRVLTTVMELPPQNGANHAQQPHGVDTVIRSARAVLEQAPPDVHQGESATELKLNLDELLQAKSINIPEAIEKETVKGYNIVFVGIGHPISETKPRFEGQLQSLVDTFDGPVAITLNGERFRPHPGGAISILVPTGAAHDRLATEVALALAKATKGQLTVLHVFDPQEDTNLLRARARRAGVSVLVDARRLGKRSSVRVEALTAVNPRPDMAIRRAILAGRYDLLVAGVSLRVGDKKFLGPRSLALVGAITVPSLLVAQ